MNITNNNNNKKDRINKILSFLTSITKKKNSVVKGLPVSEKNKITKLLEESLKQAGGEVAARERAAHIGQGYFALDKEGRKEVLSILLSFKHNQEAILKSIEVLKSDLDENKKIKEENIYNLKKAATSPRKVILRNFNFLENGLSILVEMRQDLLKFIDAGNRELLPLDKDFESLFTGLFDIGFMELERITWNSPASLLQKVMIYEAVHKIKSWTDLENRLSSDRRFYAFFHPGLKGIPLIFVEIALMKKIADSIQEILDETRPAENIKTADTAIFYSISNTQNGLRGISFGNFLIKRVVKELKAEFPNLKNFVTLSPIPKFVHWLKELDKKDNLKKYIDEFIMSKENKEKVVDQIYLEIKDIIANPMEKIRNRTDNLFIEKIKPIIEKLTTVYLVNQNNEWSNDPVLKFHLNNGAYLYRTNWMGDSSDNGLKQSLGMMVNYWYALKDVEKNHEEFNLNNKVYSSLIKKALLKKIEI